MNYFEASLQEANSECLKQNISYLSINHYLYTTRTTTVLYIGL